MEEVSDEIKMDILSWRYGQLLKQLVPHLAIKYMGAEIAYLVTRAPNPLHYEEVKSDGDVIWRAAIHRVGQYLVYSDWVGALVYISPEGDLLEEVEEPHGWVLLFQDEQKVMEILKEILKVRKQMFELAAVEGEDDEDDEESDDVGGDDNDRKKMNPHRRHIPLSQ